MLHYRAKGERVGMISSEEPFKSRECFVAAEEIKEMCFNSLEGSKHHCCELPTRQETRQPLGAESSSRTTASRAMGTLVLYLQEDESCQQSVCREEVLSPR